MAEAASKITPPQGPNKVLKLHHHAYRCRDSEETRKFYEEVLGIPLIASFIEDGGRAGSSHRYLHTFYELADGSCVAFFEVEGEQFEPLPHKGLGHHIALEIDGEGVFEEYLRRARAHGIEPRVTHHGYCKSLYMGDPNGMTVELTTKVPETAGIMAMERARAYDQLAEWRRTVARQ